MGILEKIKEIEYEMTKTQKNKATEYRASFPLFFIDAVVGMGVSLKSHPLFTFLLLCVCADCRFQA